MRRISAKRPALCARRLHKAPPASASFRRKHAVTVLACAASSPSADDGAARKAPGTLLGNVPSILGFAAVLVAFPAVLPLSFDGSGGSGGSFFGYGGDGGGGCAWNWLLAPAHADEEDDDDDEDDDEEEDDEEDEEDEDEDTDTSSTTSHAIDVDDEEPADDAADDKNFLEPPPDIDRNAFYCVEVKAEGLPVGANVPTADDLFAGLNCQPGFWVPRKKLQEDLRSLVDMGTFKEVNVKVEPVKKGSKSKKMRAVFQFQETFFPPVKTFEVTNSRCLPPDISDRVISAVKKHHDGQPTGLACLTTIRNEIEQWYTDRGFIYSTIKEFEGLDTGHIRLTVVEPKIRGIDIKFVDENMQEKPEGGKTPVEVIRRVLTMRPGQFYSMHDGRMALQQAFTLQAFENAQVLPEFVQNQEDMMDITIFLKERPMQTMDMDLEFALAPRIPKVPIPLPVTPIPGGSLTYEDRNFGQNGDSLTASLMCSNFLHPADDLSLRASYKKPYVFGTSRNEDFAVDAFNSRRLSSVFASSAAQDVPPVWIERAGAKLALVQNLTRHSKSSAQVVAQEIKTRDDTGSLVLTGSSTSPTTGQQMDNGPPTTLSGRGVDRTIDLQFTALRDTTFNVNGAIVGSRDIGEMVQGIGCGNGVFNRYMGSLTRFLKLNTPPSTSSMPPATIVLHAKHGNCVGPLASYDYHVLGGPHSCRAFSLGELGPARNFLEAAAELRLPVPVVNTQAYLYAEHARDLGSAQDLTGRPREYYNRPGSGSSLGAGIKLGPVRLEYAKDCNKNTSTWFFFFGERF